MSHPLVAAVWEQLGRRDLGNILHEIIGEHAADLAVRGSHDGDALDIEPLTRSVLWIQTLFDLQRTYLQGLSNVRDCHPYFVPYLISSETIFSTLMYLTKVKLELFPCAQPTPSELVRDRQLIVYTLLAGIRLLIQRGETITPDMKFKLERALRSAWGHSDLSALEAFLVNDLLPKAIDSIGSSDLFRAQELLLKASKIHLPVFTSGIYPFFGAPETLTTDLLTALIGHKEDQLTSFYLLYDLLWAAESALIQCHIDRRRIAQEQGYTSAAAMDVDEAFNQTQESRKKFARTVLAAFDDEFSTPSLQVLATVILSQTGGEHAPLQTRRIRDTWNQLAPMRESLDSSLGLLMRWLINRRVQMWDCNGELEAFSHDYQQHLTQWLHNSSYAGSNHQAQGRKGSPSAVYVVNCPAVHLVPGALLEEQLRSSDRKAYGQLQEKPRFLTVDVLCPLCPGNVKIQHAQMIEPLAQMSDALLHTAASDSSERYSFPDSVSRNTTSRSSSMSNSTGPLSRADSAEALRSPISPTSQNPSSFKLTGKLSSPIAPEASSTFWTRPRTGPSPEKQLIRSLSRDFKNVTLSLTGSTSLFRRTSSKGQYLPRQPRFCFSASGQCLLLWDAGSSWVMRFELNPMDGRKPRGHRYDVPGVQHAAAGYQRCAVVASVGEHYELLVFGSYRITPEAYLTIETQHRSLPITCMVMSRDDRYVAFTLKDQVKVYEIHHESFREIQLGDRTDHYSALKDLSSAGAHITSLLDVKKIGQEEERAETVIERKLQFSVDGKHFIVATHLGDQYAYVDVWDCLEYRWKLAVDGSRSFKLPPWTTDDGDLTSVFYDDFNRGVVLTAFLGREYPISFSISDENIASDPLSTRIVHAAQSPLGLRFVMANGMKQMYLCDSTNKGPLTPMRLKKASSKISHSVFRPGQLALSFPDENEVFAFWVKEGKLILRTIALNPTGETFSDYDLRSDFDRLVVERPPSSDFHRQRPPRPSSLSRQVMAEMDGIQAIPRPNLPELSAT
ncbi:hypothetical protein P175DRAFT_0535825 [Aspergillus ochraceoroseus IBT 24754]|uniref:Uncharacterized protein n=3 Tax=Aspergillus subgen. Nidulantes TaxID=2720870 RepID=A0A0F8V125_9EURO|nr:uncharacterized protein P175DRAFT_0535825 [Aspergillus ochraceoroseus IBT 24754]KKK16696.1 hypothetical protein ARAM_004016 [Aspergillus rambellii]KKK25021.1 hypothetical protein AOCH_000628 [Aspergillus ochraceoroseus]PTU17494.1 hypothetical protein P175DRAFT_0535825 [Aspergillus ochraceoroseus IBT 24754]